VAGEEHVRACAELGEIAGDGTQDPEVAPGNQGLRVRLLGHESRQQKKRDQAPGKEQRHELRLSPVARRVSRLGFVNHVAHADLFVLDVIQ
jgi:hypothetical protein